MEFKLSEIAEKIGAQLEGDDLTVKGLSAIDNPLPDTLTYILSKKYRKLLPECVCPAVIAPPGTKSDRHSILIKNDPYLGFGLAMRLFHPDHYRPEPKTEPSAYVSDSVVLGKNIYIGHHAVIEDNVKIGDNTVIHSGVHVGRDTVIGSDCYIYPNVVIMHNITIGNRVAIYATAVVGSDGFGYARNGAIFAKIPQIGTVVIEDDVEIGAGTTIDRATMGETVIGTGAILDNLVQVAHNCRVGAGSILCAQVGLAGTTTLGKNVTLAGQVGLAGHLNVGDGVVIAAQSGVPGDIEPGKIMFGTPAREAMHAKRIEAIINHLPEYIQRLRNIEKKIGND